MAEISAKDVMALRNRTGLGMMDCKKALKEAGGDVDAAEEALRSEGVGLVIAEPEKPLSLIAGRRLQLAAEAGRTTGLMLIREGQGSNAAETRWHCAPNASERRDSTLHQWALSKNKKGTLGTWTVHWNGKTAAVHPVSATGKRHESAETSR